MPAEPTVTLTLGGALAMSLVVERAVELSKNLIDALPFGGASGRFVPPSDKVEKELDQVIKVRQDAKQRDEQEQQAESEVDQVQVWRQALDDRRKDFETA